jgi:hypothetical protein
VALGDKVQTLEKKLTIPKATIQPSEVVVSQP